ncbi:allatostatin-A receptor-like [Limulus polyphemus]|uniref:Allatostatin-A receptor-like n=1 Tax=Limulus polyphemus TaxID=6850 RepID=A0ABM1RY31_LIMPO|nr:allatostatin-A receptor-like [Limulus polyphemus]
MAMDYIDIQVEALDSAEYVDTGFTTDVTISSMLTLLCNTTITNLSDCDVTFASVTSSQLERIVGIVVPILFGIIVIVGLIGNSLVVVVVIFNPPMRSTTNLLIINLAVADLLFIIFCVPFTAWDYALPYWPFGDIWCRIVQYLVIVCAYASIYTLVLMSLDRFMAVVHPITSMSIRIEKNAYIAITVTWSLILLACLPALSAHGEVSYNVGSNRYSMCVFLQEGFSYPAYQISFFLSSYVVPLVLIFCLYLLMLKRLWFHVGLGGKASAESHKSKKRITRMVVVVVVIFAVCWFPIQIVLLLKSLDQYQMKLRPERVVFQVVSHILAYMNSCVNPILYAFLSDNFRKAFRKVVTCVPTRWQFKGGRNVCETATRVMAGTKTTFATKLNNDTV